MTWLNDAGTESRRSVLRRAVPAAAAALWHRPAVGRAARAAAAAHRQSVSDKAANTIQGTKPRR